MNNFSLLNLIEFLLKSEKKDLAEKIIDVFYKNSSDYFQFLQISSCYSALRNFEKQVLVFRDLLKTAPDILSFNEAKFNFINVLRQISLHEEALFHLDYFFYFIGTPEIWITKAEILWDLNNKETAFDILSSIPDKVLDEIQKGRSEYNLGYCLLHHGQFKEGLKKIIKNVKYKKGYDLNDYEIYHSKKEIQLPFWNGEKEIKKLIVLAEAGIGDEIINLRFLKKLEERGIEAVWYNLWQKDAEINGRKGVLEVLKKNNISTITDLASLKSLNEYHWTYSQYLPINLDLEVNDLWSGPYLNAGKIPLSEKKNVGIRWGGAKIPSGRNYPLKKLFDVFQEENFDATFYSLQKDNFTEEISNFPGIINLENKLDNFEILMDYINSMDLIVSSDTSVAHAAAALGKKLAVFIPCNCYYVWENSCNKSLWYGDNVTIFKQEVPRNWDKPMQDFRKYIKEIKDKNYAF